MSNEPYQDTLHFLNTHIHMLNYTAIQHSCRHIPSPSFLLQVIETLEDDTFTVSDTVSNIEEVVTRLTAMHPQVSSSHTDITFWIILWIILPGTRTRGY